ncbi:tRNA-uridine aminocarboxypropyltransferase [Marinomonas algarum]|uniref:tRNA-uridine aminocarboxypropyltransferase n=1 Tax=Marinomonas algarum TaxID=2883105 RepID=A0A9X1IPN5_9GAMM|nr:DTW domain-containing protein [Marinomonas algarum]
MSSRCYCENCHFLSVMCVCPWRPKLATPLQILVLQDPKERRHAKNTVSLLSLALPSVRCIVIENEQIMVHTLESLDRIRWRLVFPSDNALSIESLPASDKRQIEGLIFLDATWRKAKKWYFSYAILQSFQSVCFSFAPAGEYRIRKSPSTQALSTLEACAYAIEQVSNNDMQPLRRFMQQAQQWQWRQQPSEHQHNTHTVLTDSRDSNDGKTNRD